MKINLIDKNYFYILDQIEYLNLSYTNVIEKIKNVTCHSHYRAKGVYLFYFYLSYICTYVIIIIQINFFAIYKRLHLYIFF